jgi:hypothetical protein
VEFTFSPVTNRSRQGQVSSCGRPLLPALGGRKPIDVVHEPNGRQKVEALVADFERHAARTPDGLSDGALVRLRERLALPRTTHDD